jgi:drug/metabolite transporter (DMT)-like permease
MTRIPMPTSSHRTELLALCALLAGALAAGASGVLVRLSETGPIATAFWRGFLAIPVLSLWALIERRHAQRQSSPGLLASLRDPRFLWSGVFFAGDLALWNWSLILTSIAASTLEANLAPVVVTLLAWLRWRERPSNSSLLALGLALGGLLLMVSPKLGHGGSAFLGDALGLGTACFYALYLVAVAGLRGRYPTGIVMLNTTVVYALLLLPLALTQTFLPRTGAGWAVLIGCAIAAQVLGQGLIAYALAHLPTTFGAIGLFLQSVGAAICAWVFLNEKLSAIQIAGGCLVLTGIALARWRQSSRTALPSPRSHSVPADSSAHLQRE